jgi:hypothetical protein
VTTALDLLPTFVLESGSRWGDVAAPFQWDSARAVLDPGDGPRRHWDGRPKGSSKTDDAGGWLLADLLAGSIPPGHPGYGAASDRDQAGLLLDSIAGFVQRSRLDSLVKVESWKAIHRTTGAFVEILAADASGAHGLRPSRLVVDELCNWPDTRSARKFFEALWTGLAKDRDSIGAILTTAGTPGHFSHDVYRRAIAETELWRVSMLHETAPWIDPRLVAAERRALTDSSYLRLWRNEWSAADDALAGEDDIEAALREDDSPIAPVEGQGYVLTLDVGTVHDRTVVAVAHLDGELVVVDRLWTWQGNRRKPVDLDSVEAQIVEAHERYPGPVILDPHQAVQIKQRLTKRGIVARQFDFTTQSVGRIASSLLVALRGRHLSLPRDPVLVDELSNVRLVENAAGVPRLDHPSGRHDDMAVAIALACHALTDGGHHHRGRTMRASRWRRDGMGVAVAVRDEDGEHPIGMPVTVSTFPKPPAGPSAPEPPVRRMPGPKPDPEPAPAPGMALVTVGSRDRMHSSRTPRPHGAATPPAEWTRGRTEDRGDPAPPEVVAGAQALEGSIRPPKRRRPT